MLITAERDGYFGFSGIHLRGADLLSDLQCVCCLQPGELRQAVGPYWQRLFVTERNHSDVLAGLVTLLYLPLAPALQTLRVEYSREDFWQRITFLGRLNVGRLRRSRQSRFQRNLLTCFGCGRRPRQDPLMNADHRWTSSKRTPTKRLRDSKLARDHNNAGWIRPNPLHQSGQGGSLGPMTWPIPRRIQPGMSVFVQIPSAIGIGRRVRSQRSTYCCGLEQAGRRSQRDAGGTALC